MLFTSYCVIFRVFLGKKSCLPVYELTTEWALKMTLRSCALLNLQWVYELLLFIMGKKFPIFLKKKRSNLTSNCSIPKFRFVIIIKVYIWHFLFDKSGILGKTNFYQFYHIVTSNVDRLQRGAVYRLIFVMFILRDYIHCSSSTVCHHKFSWKNFLYTDLYV